MLIFHYYLIFNKLLSKIQNIQHHVEDVCRSVHYIMVCTTVRMCKERMCEKSNEWKEVKSQFVRVYSNLHILFNVCNKENLYGTGFIYHFSIIVCSNGEKLDSVT